MSRSIHRAGALALAVAVCLGASSASAQCPGGISLNPASVALEPGQSKAFTARHVCAGGDFIWGFATNASGGTVTRHLNQTGFSTALYTAGAKGDVTDVLRVTHGAWSATAIVTVSPGTAATLIVSPSSVTLAPMASEDFAASGGGGIGYAWAFVTNASGGTLSAGGGYTAGPTGGVVDTIGVRDSLGTLATAIVNVTPALVITPSMLSVAPETSRTLAASGGSEAGYSWTLATNASGGSLSTEGVYTAGAVGGVTDIVDVTDSLGARATAVVTVTPTPTGGCGATGGGSATPLLALVVVPLLTKQRRRRCTAS